MTLISMSIYGFSLGPVRYLCPSLSSLIYMVETLSPYPFCLALALNWLLALLVSLPLGLTISAHVSDDRLVLVSIVQQFFFFACMAVVLYLGHP
jgi:hypothetical protein